MKRNIFILFPLLLAGCANGSVNSFEVYLNDNKVTTNEYEIYSTSADAYKSSTNYSFSLTLSIKNLTNTTQKVTCKNTELVKEDNNAKYTITTIPFTAELSLDSGIEKGILFNSQIPTSLDEKYYFSTTVNNVNYKVHLYDKPAEIIKQDVTVYYRVDNKYVHSEIIKSGSTLSSLFVYESLDHLSYCDTWIYNGKQVTTSTVIERDVILEGVVKSNFKTTTTSSDQYTFINGINHVPSDGDLVVGNQYEGKDVALGTYGIYNNALIKQIYLPLSLVAIYGYNFTKCPNLKTVYYVGDQDSWNLVKKEFFEIPQGVNLVLNTRYKVPQ